MDRIFNVVYGLFRGLLFYLDQIVYWFIPVLYKLLLYLANVDLMSGNVPIEALIRRLYIFVGVFMLFRLSFSIVNYIVNPDAFSDQTKGFSNMVRRVMLALVLLVGIPWVFKVAYVVQGKIITSNILPRLVLGESVSNADLGGLEESINTSAIDLQFLVFSPFFSLNYDSTDDNGNVISDLSACVPSASEPALNVLGSSDMGGNEACLTQVATLMDADKTVHASFVKLNHFFREADSSGNVLEDKRKFKSFGGLLNWTLSNGEFAISYFPIVSTICGGYLVLLLLSFCIDVAARAIRLLFLQILSPIAIISSIDPTNGDSRLKDWFKECLLVWASLFIRLLVIFLIIQLTRVISNSIYNGSLISTDSGLSLGGGMFIWLYLFLILGVFTAAKKIPDLIEKATGIKLSGELELNPLKSLQSNVGVTGLTGAALGAVGGAASGALAAWGTARANEHNVARSLLSGAGAFVTGGVTGLGRGGLAGGAKGWNAGLQSGGRIARRMDVREATGGVRGLPGMTIDRARDFMGAPTIYESMEKKAGRYDEVGSAVDQMQQRIVSQLEKKSDAWKTSQANRVRYEQAFKAGEPMDDGTRQSVVDTIGAAYERSNTAMQEAVNKRDAELAQLDPHASDYAARRQAIADKYSSSITNLQAKMDRLTDMGHEVQTSGIISDATYVALQNELYDTEQALIADYYDHSSDEQLELLKGAATKASRDAGYGDTLPDTWYDIAGSGNDDSLKSRSEHAAVTIRASKGYNDARDRDQAIHSARTDAHQKFH